MTLSDPMVGAQPPIHDIAAEPQTATLQQRHAELEYFVASIRDRLTTLSHQIDSRSAEPEPCLPDEILPQSVTSAPSTCELEPPPCQVQPNTDQADPEADENAVHPGENSAQPNELEVAPGDEQHAEPMEHSASDNSLSDPLESLNALKLRLAKQIQDA